MSKYPKRLHLKSRVSPSTAASEFSAWRSRQITVLLGEPRSWTRILEITPGVAGAFVGIRPPLGNTSSKCALSIGLGNNKRTVYGIGAVICVMSLSKPTWRWFDARTDQQALHRVLVLICFASTGPRFL